jgi:hypothetical protein
LFSGTRPKKMRAMPKRCQGVYTSSGSSDATALDMSTCARCRPEYPYGAYMHEVCTGNTILRDSSHCRPSALKCNKTKYACLPVCLTADADEDELHHTPACLPLFGLVLHTDAAEALLSYPIYLDNKREYALTCKKGNWSCLLLLVHDTSRLNKSTRQGFTHTSYTYKQTHFWLVMKP